MRSDFRLLLLLVLLLFAACNSRANTVGLRGEVSVGGQMVERGAVSFWPVEGTIGPSAGAPIVNSRSTLKVRVSDLPDKNKADFCLKG